MHVCFGWRGPLAVALFVAMDSSLAFGQLHVAEPAVHAGTVLAGKPLSGRFEFVNVGNQPIQFLDAKPSCACLKPELPQQLIPPGGKGAIEMAVRTLGQPGGPSAWAARVQYRQGEKTAECTLVLKADLISEVSCEPAALQLLGSNALQAQVVIKDSRQQPFTIRAVNTTSPHVKAVAKAPETSNGITRWVIRLEVTDDYPDGRREEIISIATDDAMYRELTVPVTIVRNTRQRIVPTPVEVKLEAAAGQSAARVLLVRDADGQPVVIEGVASDHPAVTGSFAAGPGNMATIKVRCTAVPASAESLRTMLRIQVKEPVAQTLMVPVEVRTLTTITVP
ncbi:MAG: DUF1573 domain-containing protein [Planctomycetia bacterium]|nr:DUF1573 domain-containing protein [Planctomycetia bacterium]